MAELTDKAIELLREKGWIRGQAFNHRGYCVMGALDKATTLTNTSRAQLGRAMNVLMDMVDLSPPDWNDHHARDIDHVIEVLKLVGEKLDLERERSRRSWS